MGAEGKSIPMTASLYSYLVEHNPGDSDIGRRLRAETAKMPAASLQIPQEQGAFLAWLVGLIGAERALEIGTFTGYSALRVAQALPTGGKLVACDVSDEWTSVAQRYWDEAGVADKIDLRLAPAVETLDELISEGASFDFAFIDADKGNYERYYERCVTLVRAGGLIAVDNMLWSGRVADATFDDANTTAIRDLNRRIAEDTRVHSVLLAVADGIVLARVLDQ